MLNLFNWSSLLLHWKEGLTFRKLNAQHFTTYVTQGRNTCVFFPGNISLIHNKFCKDIPGWYRWASVISSDWVYSLNNLNVEPEIFSNKAFFLDSSFACIMKILNT